MTFQGEYERARQQALQGHHVLARQAYEQLDSAVKESALKALIRNDLAVLAALADDINGARQGFRTALALDEQCSPAKANLGLLDEDYPEQPTAAQALADAAAPAPTARPEGAIKVALVSFLFNWPTTGGGNIHTFELARFLAQAGYEVRHFYPRHVPWRIGNVTGLLPFPSEALEFDEASWNVPAIQDRFRQAVQAFAPDYVLITDSWNV